MGTAELTKVVTTGAPQKFNGFVTRRSLTFLKLIKGFNAFLSESLLAFTAPDESTTAPLISFDMGTGFLNGTDWGRLDSFGGSVFFLLSDLDRKSILTGEKEGEYIL